MDLKKHYNDRDFKYLCPCCRTNGSSKKRYSKDLRKKQDNYERYKNRFDQVNSGSNILCKSQQLNDQKDSISESQGDDRYYSQNNFANRDDSKYGDSEVEGKDDDFDQDISQQNGGYNKNEQSDSIKKKSKPQKKRINYEKAKTYKRSRDDITSHEENGYQSIEQFTYFRSLKLAKEREDIIEPRTLFSKVFATIKVQDRIQQDIEHFISKIINKISLDSDEVSSSPLKAHDQDNVCLASLSSLKLPNNCMKSQNESEYSKQRLRTRRNKKLVEA